MHSESCKHLFTYLLKKLTSLPVYENFPRDNTVKDMPVFFSLEFNPRNVLSVVMHFFSALFMSNYRENSRELCGFCYSDVFIQYSHV